MPQDDAVARFIARNNFVIDEIEDLLDEATNKALPSAQQDRALATAGHLACRALKRAA